MKVRIRGFEMAYDDTGGNRVPLLLIHGYPHDRTLWSTQRVDLSDIARVIAPDLRGFGESGMPSGVMTMDDYADDVRALLDALSIKNAVVGGLSMGGYIAFAFYRKYGHRVRALILADTRPQPDSPEGKKARDESAVVARTEGVGAIADRMLPKMLTPKTISETPDLANAARAMMARQPVDGVVAALIAMRDRPDSTPTLAQISVPTLVITGREDTLIPAKDAEMMQQGIKGARLVSIGNAAHMSNFEQPEAFSRAVMEFVKIAE
jgi:pimeloyl-ACP methyl ester carboxylesterase